VLLLPTVQVVLHPRAKPSAAGTHGPPSHRRRRFAAVLVSLARVRGPPGGFCVAFAVFFRGKKYACVFFSRRLNTYYHRSKTILQRPI
jgi:hypothetical protein